MNKKFFAALASATMAFSATGSLAVFADEFTDEVAPVAPTTPNEKPTVTEVVWNKENFGDLADLTTTDVTFPKDVTVTLKKGEKVDTKDLAKATTITIPATFNGEVKGLEYFKGLTTFTANTGTVTNTSLDFSANTNLTYLGIKNAPNLRNVVLPEAFENKDGEKSYKLNTLALDGTKLLSIDLTEQTGLTHIELTDGMLKDIQLPSNAKKELETLLLKNNMLETMNLKGFEKLALLNLSYNHIGMLDLTGVKANGTNVQLGYQKIYVAEDSASVNVNELYPSFDYSKASVATAATDGKFETKNGNYTGVFTLVDGVGSYNYAANNTNTPNTMNVKFVAANPMFRLYNPNSGEHFYTKDANEQEALVKLGWNDEGYGWVAPIAGGDDVYRLYNPNAGDHHYTTSLNEKAVLVAAGWKDEGIGWYSDGPVTVYRQYNPNAKAAGAHNYTMDLAENDYLVSVGWTPEGNAWQALK